MKQKILLITETAFMLALLITLQWITKAFGQLVTGACVNAVLAITVFLVGLPGGLAVAVLSPIFAFVLGVAPNVLTVPAIMVGNSVYVLALYFLYKRNYAAKIAAVILASAGKFAVLYALVNWVVCGLAAQPLLESGLLKMPMLQLLPANFGLIQLITALIGGGVGMLLSEAVKKAIHR